MEGHVPWLWFTVVTGVAEGYGDQVGVLVQQVGQFLSVSLVRNDGHHRQRGDEGADVFGGDAGEVHRVSAQDQSAGAAYAEVEEDALEGTSMSWASSAGDSLLCCLARRRRWDDMIAVSGDGLFGNFGLVC